MSKYNNILRFCFLVIIALVLLIVPLTTNVKANPQSNQQIVLLLNNHSVRSKPNNKAKKLTIVAARRPITKSRTALPVLLTRIDTHGHKWMKVRIPGRVLGKPTPPQTGWISASQTDQYISPWQVVVVKSTRHVYVYKNGKRVKSFRIIVGKSSTPTPSGNFFVEENIRMPAGSVGAPFALALSARSSIYQEFEGGPGQIAMHGLEQIGGDIGTAQSHGCIRMNNADITWMAKHIGQGTSVTIK